MSKHDVYALVQPILDEMEMLYLHDSRPWIVGFSGGKDSSTVCQLVFWMLERLPESQRSKPVYVVSSDTLVENPIIIDYLNEISHHMGVSAKQKKLNLTTHIVKPRVEDTFWSLVIGLGYPTPEPPGFRWCTDRLKIEPSNRFIREKIKNDGEVVILLGVRKSESVARAQRIEKREIDGKILNRHEVIDGAYVYNPITELSTDEIWNILLLSDEGQSPWGTDNRYLYSLYKSSDGGECPFTLAAKEELKDVPTCGNSRFGCWSCTMVKEDKSLKGFIESGETWLRPLHEFRSWLLSNRNNHDFRDSKRRNGTIYKRSDGSFGYGPFTLEARRIILEKLLITEKTLRHSLQDDSYELITLEELKKIDEIWDNEGDLTRRLLVDTYFEVYGVRLPWDHYKKPLFEERVLNLMEATFDSSLDPDEKKVPYELVKKLVLSVNRNKHYTHRPAIKQNFDRILNETWLHYEEMMEGLRNEDQ
ncbi:DNA phosphorothioation system sulfurtransferase DndC [Paenibacillus elgii]|uniref:DNA phosphorothioation system sulfurtransferase DndC n=1 Tax=Paenibacillus elgii TaxID=189691 RepID=UPI0013D82E84|nr:DNA phosphorothioation system sulfurtransferase DndC [Paenibacillus elgii]